MIFGGSAVDLSVALKAGRAKYEERRLKKRVEIYFFMIPLIDISVNK